MAFNLDQDKKLSAELNIPKGFKPYTSIIVGYKKNDEINIPKRITDKIFYIK
jgi:hypothetical protein